jgi:serine/threonine protein kinase
MATKQRCPKCNQLNDLGIAQCVRCAAPLIQRCTICGTPRPWYVERCANCEVRGADTRLFTELFQAAPLQELAGRYQIKATLASTRVTRVYHASDLRDSSRQFAIKELSPVALFRPEERRQAEATLQARVRQWQGLAHSGVPAIVESFKHQDRYYVVFEYIAGETLEQILLAYGRLGSETALNWGAQLADILRAMHRQPVPLYAPFLSPSHVMVTPDGRVHMVGLGLGSLFAPASATPLGAARGYAAPELEQGQPSPRSDIYTVGRLMTAVLTGQLLEKGGARALPLRQAVQGLAAQTVKLIGMATERDPAQRFASAEELLNALWEPSRGPLEPMANWRPESVSQAGATQAAPLRAARPSRPARPAQEGEARTMADLGFERDPRFGPRPQDRPTAVASAVASAAPQGAPKLSVQPNHFDLKDLSDSDRKRLVLAVRNAGTADLVARAVSHVGWLRAPSKAVRVPPGKRAQMILTLDAAQLPGGHVIEPQALSLETNAGNEWIGVTADVPSGPELAIETPLLDFGALQDAGERTLTLRVRNPGRQPLAGSLQPTVPWLRLPNTRLRLRGGESVDLPVQLLLEQLPSGAQVAPDGIRVESDGGQARIEVRAWYQTARLDLGSTHMDFGRVLSGSVAERYLYVSNTGDGHLEGSLRSLLPWLQVFPTRFDCAPGDMVQLTVTLDSTGLGDGALQVPQALRLQTNVGNRALSLQVQVAAPKLSVRTPRVALGAVLLGERKTAQVMIANEGSAPLEATLTPTVDWLSVEGEALHIEPGQTASVLVTADTSRFAGGQETEVASALRVVSGSQILEIAAHIRVLQPSLEVEPQGLDFGYVERTQPETRTFAISNRGTGDLAWSAQTDAEWVELSATSGLCYEGQSQTLRVTAYGLAIPAEKTQASGTLAITSDAGRLKVPLRIAFAAPLIAADRMYVDLASRNRAGAQATLRLFNHGLGLLRGIVVPDQTWLVVDRASFDCPMGRSVELRLSTDMDEFSMGQFRGEGTLHIESNGGPLKVAVSLEVALTPRFEASESVLLARRAADGPWLGRLVVRNAGLASGHIELAPTSSALTLSRSVYDIKPGKSVRVSVQLDGPPPGTEELAILLNAEGEKQRVCILITDALTETGGDADEG